MQVVDTTTWARSELAQETLHRSGFLRLRATGGSMLPAIAPGDVLGFRACTADQAELGQVVLVRSAERLVAHRLLERHGDRLLTRGDALGAADIPIPAEHLIGVLAEQHRGHKPLLAGGRHWLRRQRTARWLIRRTHFAHRLFCRIPALATLTA